jgi:serine/threonine-protein kinase
MIGTQISQYRLLEKLGEGGMGVVYKGMDTLLDRVVAVKLVSADRGDNVELLERFKSEAKVQATLSHPNIATLYSYLVWEGRAVMVMEFIEGETVQQIISRRGPLPSEMAIPMFKQALLGVGAAHRRGIVHRDIKPANIMVNSDGLVKVMDFGIAKVLGVEGTTRTNLRMGTAWYMAPEQVLNRPVDARTDIYALGVTLYEILSGQVPFRADSDYEVLSSHVQRVPELPTEHYPHIPQCCVAAVMRALAKDPEQRFASTEEFSAALDQSAPASLPTAVPAVQTGPPTFAGRQEATKFTVVKDAQVPEPVPVVAQPSPAKRTPWLGITLTAACILIVAAAALILYAMRERGGHGATGGHQAAGNQQGSVTGEEARRMQAEQDRAAEELREQLAKEQSGSPSNGGAQPRPVSAGGSKAGTSIPKAQGPPVGNPPKSSGALAPHGGEAEAAHLRMLTGTWSGTYICSQGVTGATLQIVASSDQNVGALLQFAVPNSRPGAYFMRGTFDPSSNRIAMKFTSWKYQPAGYAAAGITGTVNLSTGELRGTVILPGCAALSMRKQ